MITTQATQSQQMKIEPETHYRVKIGAVSCGFNFTKYINSLLERFENDVDIKNLNIPKATKEYVNTDKKSLTISKDVYTRLKVFSAKNDFTFSVALDKLIKRSFIDGEFKGKSSI